MRLFLIACMATLAASRITRERLLDGEKSRESENNSRQRETSEKARKKGEDKESFEKATKKGKDKEPGYTETVGYHQTGKYLLFATYSDPECGDMEESHGYALGVCQPFTYPGLFWINYAGTSSKDTSVLYQFYKDQECTVPATFISPDFPAVGNEHWPTGCNDRKTYSKTFNVDDRLPSFKGGTLILQYLSEEACKANQLDAATYFSFVKPGKCAEIVGQSMFANIANSKVTDVYGSIVSCTPDGGVTVEVYPGMDLECSGVPIKTNTFERKDYCKPGQDASGEITGYVNVKCL